MPSKKIKADPVLKKKLKGRPYYAFLYARNILKNRLPEDLELIFAQDPESAYLYATHVLKGKLPDVVHNALIIGTFDNEKKSEYVAKYLQYLKDKKCL